MKLPKDVRAAINADVKRYRVALLNKAKKDVARSARLSRDPKLMARIRLQDFYDSTSTVEGQVALVRRRVSGAKIKNLAEEFGVRASHVGHVLGGFVVDMYSRWDESIDIHEALRRYDAGVRARLCPIPRDDPYWDGFHTAA